MKREDIIRMAREAGFRDPNPHDGCMGLAFDFRDGADTGASLERFAAIVAAAEREACAKVCDEVDKESSSQWPARLSTMIRARSTP